jgi:hypothetical protein
MHDRQKGASSAIELELMEKKVEHMDKGERTWVQ